jgi:mannosyl-oligosaccharide alpha-1,2-mannosidase
MECFSKVNIFKTIIHVLGGLLSAYHLSGGWNSGAWGAKGSGHPQGPNPNVYLDNAKDLGNHLMVAFTSSPSLIPFSNVIIQEWSVYTTSFGGGFSSTFEVTIVQMEFWYLSYIIGDPMYTKATMVVYEHFKGIPKIEGLDQLCIGL